MTSGSSAATVQEALTDEQIAACFPVIQTLRLHFTSEADFVSRVRRQQQEGYHLVYIKEDGAAQALAGYRIREDIETPHPKCAHAATLERMRRNFACADSPAADCVAGTCMWRTSPPSLRSVAEAMEKC